MNTMWKIGQLRQEKPVVSTVDCFDKLRVPPDHVSRSPSDTYYVNADYVLRTHTSAALLVLFT